MSKKQLWAFLAPTEEGKELEFSILENPEEEERKQERLAKGPSRPGSAITDSTGRKVVYGKSRFHAAVQSEQEQQRAKEKNHYEGGSFQGLPDGVGAKIYSTRKSWTGRLLPFGCIMKEPFTPDQGIQGSVIQFSWYKTQIGLLGKFQMPIILVEGRDTVRSVLDCAKVLERLRLANYKLRAAVITFASEQVFQEVASKASYSEMLQFFSFPIVGTLSSEFLFQPLSWPDEDHICGLLPQIQQQYDEGREEQIWKVSHRTNHPPILYLHAVNKHTLTLQGTFPLQPIGALKVELEWRGKEVFVGNFKEGAKDGRGIFLRSSGDKFVGMFKGGVAHGKGSYYWKNGDRRIGEWHHGNILGKGEMRTFKMQVAATTLQSNFRMWIARRVAEHRQLAQESKRRAESRAARFRAASAAMHLATSPIEAFTSAGPATEIDRTQSDGQTDV